MTWSDGGDGKWVPKSKSIPDDKVYWKLKRMKGQEQRRRQKISLVFREGGGRTDDL